MRPSALEPLVELAVEVPLISAMLLSINAEMIDCGVCVPVADVAPEVATEAFELVPFSALIRLSNAELKLELTLLEALAPPLRLPSNSLLLDSVTRPVSAATVAATPAAGSVLADVLLLALAVVLVVAACVLAVPELFKTLDKIGAWLLPTLPIDIMTP